MKLTGNQIIRAKIKCNICKKQFAVLIRLGNAYCEQCWKNKIGDNQMPERAIKDLTTKESTELIENVISIFRHLMRIIVCEILTGSGNRKPETDYTTNPTNQKDFSRL